MRPRNILTIIALSILIQASAQPRTYLGAPPLIIATGAEALLAARAIQNLEPDRQPAFLIMLNPEFPAGTLPGTHIPAIRPPYQPKTRLLVIQQGQTQTSPALLEYIKTWKGYDGIAQLRILPETASTKMLIDSFCTAATPSTAAAPNTNPAAIPVPSWGSQHRHPEKLALLAKQKFDLFLIGNSITNNFEKPEYQPVWNEYFAPRHAINLGYSGYRTENILWNLQNGELQGQTPKVAIIEIGTNNIDEKNYPTRHTAAQLAGGIEAIVKTIRQQLPATKIIILRSFPGCYGGPNPTSHRAILDRASAIVSGLADNKNIFFCDVNHIFLNLDGTIKHELMPDWLHPNADGAKAWAQAMEPLLAELMGDSMRDTGPAKNTAITPVTKLEEDSYSWWDRHNEVLRIKDSIDPEIVLIGNSITHFWGGQPALKNRDGSPRQPNGPRTWDSLFHAYRVLNLGFGWDRTQNVLWRLDHGELDGVHPRTVVIDIGTNNTSQTEHARMNTAEEIVEGIGTICGRVRSKQPNARIILMAVFPREQSPQHPRRQLINDINEKLKAFADEHQLTFVDIGPQFLAADGTMLPGLTSDYCHPTEKGYAIWANALRPLLKEY